MSESRPNILFMLADDLGWGDVGYHGSAIHTPTIDRLASTAVEMDRHYVWPVCTPTRASLLSGRHASRFGVHATYPSNAPVFPDGYPTLASVLRDAGYRTGLFGKWHLGSRPDIGPNKFGFEEAYGSLAGGVDPYNHRYKKGRYSVTWHRNCEFVEERGHVTDLITDAAVEWIEKTDGPWFCYVPFTAVHFPVKAPQEWINLYAGEQFDEDPERDLSYRIYAAYASHMDHAVGRLLETLERTCQVDNTLVVFTSDNGATPAAPLSSTTKYPGYQPASPRLGCNLPLRGKKAQMYDGGTRTPTVVSWPERLPARRVTTPVQVSDWMPTLCGLAGAKLSHDPKWDGVDIFPLLERDEPPPERALYWNRRDDEFAVRVNEWKLIARGANLDSAVELYHMDRDPRETTSVTTQEPAVVDRLLERIRAERAKDHADARPEVDGPDVDDPETEP